MAQPRMRPRFSVDVAGEIEDVMQALRDGESRVDHLEGEFSSRHGVLGFPKVARHFWSPFMSLTIEAASANPREYPTRIRGFFSPHPHIWQAFVFIYLTLFATGFFAAMFGLAQLFLSRTPSAFLISICAAALAAFVYGATFIGQGLGAAEMYTLRRFLDETIEQVEERSRREPRAARDSAQL